MKKITLRTKIEATLVLLLLVSIVAAASVISVTRMISDSHDDVDTYIRNSNGNYWECTEANIQAAIDDWYCIRKLLYTGFRWKLSQRKIRRPYDNNGSGFSS